MDTNVNDWKEKRRAKESRASLLRRLRTPVLCVASIGAVTFLGIPLLFNVIGLTPTVVEIPEATPLPETPLEPVAALSAAVRYLHAPASVGSLSDFEHMLTLTRLFLQDQADKL